MKLKLFFTLVTISLETLFYAGAIYGWASIHDILVEEGFFLSDNDDGNLANSTTTNGTSSQLRNLNLVYTIATSVAPMTIFPTGVLLDMKGVWVARTVLLAMIASGFLLIVLAKTSSCSLLLFVAFLLLDVGGMGLFSVNSHIGNLFPEQRSVVTSAMCGCGISSTVTFYIIRQIYYTFGINFETIFVVAASSLLPFWLSTFLLTPRFTIPKPLPSNYDYGYKELPCFKSPMVETLSGNTLDKDTSNQTDTDTRNFKECLLDKPMISNVLHFIFAQLSLIYFMGTANDFIAQVVGEENTAAITMNTTVYSMVQGSAFLVTPLCTALIGLIHHKVSMKTDSRRASVKCAACTTLISDCCLIGLFSSSLIPIYGVQYITYVFVVLCRSTIYGSVGPFIATYYPAKHFGKLFGVTFGIGGLVLFAQYPINILASSVLPDNSDIYYLFLISSVLLTGYPAKVLFGFYREDHTHQG